ncbi:tetraacyldisaccharide 4'-kinase [Edaphobacter flagellatus]|uniref:tetraacyldisaccharide 4'-kinase n=1 Tax=Edaphobacter flagellatus TaxID=1933044 RepID=UPI0021B1BC27|nr:tetraacyldisaccharide 4'-kinase [Edaphobacter flagellatus]
MSARRPWLVPLAPLYGAVVTTKRKLYRWGWLKQNRLPAPVVSIGSVSAGGAGKTPFVAMLAEVLHRKGYSVSILTRGYGRTSELTERVEPYDDPEWHGDEPVLLAQRSTAPVFAGADRYEAGLLAEKVEPGEGRTAVHLLDDGFQHLRLARNVDIVLLTLEDTKDMLLPAGNLREPIRTVAEADVVVVRDEEAAALKDVLDSLREKGHRFATWTIRRTLNLHEDVESPLPTMPLAFCGIARPDNFTKMLTSSRYEPAKTVAFADHHPYTESDVAQLIEDAKRIGANGFVTTEKDAVKISPEMRRQLEYIGRLVVAQLRVELVGEKEALTQLVTMVGGLDRRKNRA